MRGFQDEPAAEGQRTEASAPRLTRIERFGEMKAEERIADGL